MKKKLGFGLSELLISLFLASLLSAVLIQTYLWSKVHYRRLHHILKIHFEVQWAQDLLADSIRRAGFTPCLPIDQLDWVDRRLNKQMNNFALRLTKEEIKVNRMSEYFGQLLAIINQQEILVSTDTAIRLGQSLLIADCEQAEVHKIVQMKKNSSGFVLNLDSPIYFSYSPITYAGQWLEERWFIKENQKGKSLYYQQIHSEELTPFIKAMSIKSEKHVDQEQVDIRWDLENKTVHHFSVLKRT